MTRRCEIARRVLIVLACSGVAVLAHGVATSRAVARDADLPGKPILVGDVQALAKAVTEARPGDEIVVRRGRYSPPEELTVRLQSSEVKPLVIRNEKPGEAILNGTHTLRVRGAKWITIEGFVFANRVSLNNSWLNVFDSEHIRISRNRLAYDESGVGTLAGLTELSFSATSKSRFSSVLRNAWVDASRRAAFHRLGSASPVFG